MEEIYFKNGQEGGTPVPKVMWWYCIEKKYKGVLNADYANRLLNNDLKDFFKKYPNELKNKVIIDNQFKTNVTTEDDEFYKKELGGLI